MFQKDHQQQENDKKEFPQLQFQMDPIKSSCHHQITLENVPILFPQKPYVVQQQYMKSVIQALNVQSNALLQSPTGTGKTLALLCATLAWTHQCNKKMKIIYSSRTHSQLQQVANELSKTAYKPRLSMLGSRNQLCINDLIEKVEGIDIDKKCSKLRQSDAGCQYYHKSKIESAAKSLQNQVLDIEDFKSYCKDNNLCPFYLERQRNDNADIILLPYNYLLNIKLKGYLNIQDCIIIFDEAHNVVQAAEDGQSFSLSQLTVIKGQQKLNKWVQVMENIGPEDKEYKEPSQLIKIAANLNRLQNHLNQFLNNFQVRQDDQYCKSFNPRVAIKILSYYFSFSDNMYDNYLTNLIYNGIQHCILTDEELEQYESYCAYMFKQIKFFKKHPGTHLNSLLNFFNSLNQLFCKSKLLSNERQLIDSYKLFIEKTNDKLITLSMNCLDPSIGFQQLINNQVYSIIITSGTLTPFESWPEELNIKFEVPPLENDHLDGITNNVKGFVLKEFNFSYQHRNNQLQLINLGKIIIQLCDVIPGGMLIVFSSYQIMNMIKIAWNDFKILNELVNKKALYWEPANSKTLQAVFSQYSQDARKKGAILFCVQRGKVSEGIDFSDELCRAVFLIGVPFLPSHEVKVIEKKRFIDSQQNSLKSSAWYMQQAVRSANQALGRVIRHKNDYGAIFLCDSRFQTSKLSKWVQPSIQKIPQWTQEHCNETLEFFKQKASQYQQFQEQDEINKKVKINDKE